MSRRQYADGPANYYPQHALAVTCPTCGAKPDRPCHTVTRSVRQGETLRRCHRSRIFVAETIAQPVWRVRIRRIERLSGILQAGTTVTELLFGSYASALAYYATWTDAMIAENYVVVLEHREAGRYRFRQLLSTSRRCDARCHNAKRPKCDCWCGGLFHGAKGAAARQAFAKTFGEDVPPLPLDEAEPLLAKTSAERWAAGIEAAKKARGA